MMTNNPTLNPLNGVILVDNVVLTCSKEHSMVILKSMFSVLLYLFSLDFAAPLITSDVTDHFCILRDVYGE